MCAGVHEALLDLAAEMGAEEGVEMTLQRVALGVVEDVVKEAAAGVESAMYAFLESATGFLTLGPLGAIAFGMSMGGITPVLAAADIVRYDIVLILLEAGAQYETTDDTGRDLISRIKAVQNRFSEGATQKASLDRVIKWLEEKGVKL